MGNETLGRQLGPGTESDDMTLWGLCLLNTADLVCMTYCIGPEQPCIWWSFHPGMFCSTGQKGGERAGRGAGAGGGESKEGEGKAEEKLVFLFEGGGKAGSAILFCPRSTESSNMHKSNCCAQYYYY